MPMMLDRSRMVQRGALARAPKLDTLAEEIRAAGGVAETAQADALDEYDVNRCVDVVVERAGSLDISFNLTSYGDAHGTPLIEMSLEDFVPQVPGDRAQLLGTPGEQILAPDEDEPFDALTRDRVDGGAPRPCRDPATRQG